MARNTTLLTLYAFTLAPLAVLGVGPPTVKVRDATVIGTTDGTTTSFLGIPFAQAPYVLGVLFSAFYLDI